MTNYDEKELKALEKIINTIEDLDNTIDEIEDLSLTDKKHQLKTWFTEKKAIFEIKKILHEAGKYEEYDEKELEKIENYFKNLID